MEALFSIVYVLLHINAHENAAHIENNFRKMEIPYRLLCVVRIHFRAPSQEMGLSLASVAFCVTQGRRHSGSRPPGVAVRGRCVARRRFRSRFGVEAPNVAVSSTLSVEALRVLLSL